jgi:uncharacterized RDD family membrane protein YckC
VAGFWRRLAAGTLDGAVLFLVFVILQAASALAMHHPLPRLSQLGPDYFIDVAVNGDALAVTALALLGIIGFLYFFIFTAVRGQTPGKRALGLRVIDGWGKRPSLGRALLRTLAYVPSLLVLALGFFWIGFDREKRGLHDWIADTYVIRAVTQ